MGTVEQRLDAALAQLKLRDAKIARLEEEKLKTVKGEVKEEPSGAAEQVSPKSGIVYVSYDRKIGTYSGEVDAEGKPTKGSVSLEPWIMDIEQHFLARNVRTDEQVSVIRGHLSGLARLEIDGRSDLVSGAEVFTVLREVFNQSGNVHQRRQAFYHRKQRRDESLLTFSLGLLQLWNAVERAEVIRVSKHERNGILKYQFMEGVCELTLKRELKGRFEEHPEEEYHKFRDWAREWINTGNLVTPEEVQPFENPSGGRRGGRSEEIGSTDATTEVLKTLTSALVRMEESRKEDTAKIVEALGNAQSHSQRVPYEKEQDPNWKPRVQEGKTREVRCWRCQDWGHTAVTCLAPVPVPKKDTRNIDQRPNGQSQTRDRNESSRNVRGN